MAAAASTLPDEPLVEARIPGDRHQLVKDTFTSFDKDGSGNISEWELREAFKTLGEDITDQACRDLIKEVDSDNDGEISFPEFCKVRQHETKAKLPLHSVARFVVHSCPPTPCVGLLSRF